MRRRLRLASGLVLIAFVTSHLINHALGLASLEAMEAGRRIFLALWRSPPGTLLLYLALGAHLVLGLGSLYRRRRLRMPAWEAGQMLLGLLLPPLLAEHLVGTRFLSEFHGVDDGYTYVVLVLWLLAPEAGIRQTAVLLIAWLHGCMGLHYWLRFRPWYPRLAPLFLAAAVLLPVMALVGFASAGKEVARLAADPAWLRDAMAVMNFPGDEAITAATALRMWIVIGFAGALAAVLAARLLRHAVEMRRGDFQVSYPESRQVRATTGMTVLEVSRSGGIPHASVCGGRGRCSTCRVRVGQGAEHLPPPDEGEQRVLKRIGAPPGVRLACQLRPLRDIEVTPLLPPGAGLRAGGPLPGYYHGVDREIAILFADIRAFTELAETMLPYDVVFLLNRYFRAMGTAIEQTGGRLDKFVGDGVMAIFGLDGDASEGSRRALAAARAMSEALVDLNQSLRPHLPSPIRIGIGIHAGPVVVGEMGYAAATAVTAVGDAVNIASRLEALTREHDCQLIVSEEIAIRAEADLSEFETREIAIRGRREPLRVRLVADARSLPDLRGEGTAVPPHTLQPSS